MEIILHPELHSKELPILLSAVVILILILVLTTIIIYQRQEPLKISHEEKLRVALVWFISSLVIFFISSSVPILYLTSKENCFRCHKKDSHIKEFEIAHQNIPCISCHSKEGLIGRIDNFFKVAGKIYKIVSNKPVEKTFCISYNNCLSCHSDIVSSTVVRNRIIVRHKEIINEGQPCTNCHPATVRGRRIATSQRIMANCGRCHNERSASAKCVLCHTPFGSPPRFPPDLSNFPKVSISGENPLIESTETTDIQGAND